MVKFLKIREVKDPVRDRGNAGVDVFIPEFSKAFKEELTSKNPGITILENEIILQPTQAILIPSGLKTHFPENIALIATNKSGQATKKRLDVGATCVDSSYRGEIHIHVYNTGSLPVKLYYGEKVVQFVPYLIDTDTISVFGRDNTEADFYGNELETERGEGGFGSTGTVEAENKEMTESEAKALRRKQRREAAKEAQVEGEPDPGVEE